MPFVPNTPVGSLILGLTETCCCCPALLISSAVRPCVFLCHPCFYACSLRKGGSGDWIVHSCPSVLTGKNFWSIALFQSNIKERPTSQRQLCFLKCGGKKQPSQRGKKDKWERKCRQTSTVTLFVRHQLPASPSKHPSRQGIAALPCAVGLLIQMGLGNRRRFEGKVRIIPPAAHSLVSGEVLHPPDYLLRLSFHQFQSEFIFGEYGWPRLRRALQIAFRQSFHISHGNISLGMI